MLEALNIFFHIIHSGLVLFMLFGAFFRRLVPYHFPVVCIIWVAWLGIGAYIGTLGYCPLTDWHWQIKEKMGETHLPPSYIEYIYTKITGKDVDDTEMSNIIAGTMIAITLFSAFRYFKRKR